MRILFILPVFPAVSETFILDQVFGMIERGHEVTVVADKAGKGPRHLPEASMRGLDGRTFYNPSVPRSRIRRLAGAASLLKDLQRGDRGEALRCLNVFAEGKKAASLELLFGAEALFRAGRCYDAVQCHFAAWGARAQAYRDLGILDGRLFVAVHGVDIAGASFESPPSEYRRLKKGDATMLPVSHRWAEKLHAMGFAVDRVVVHHMGVDTGRLAFRPRTLGAGERVCILSVARLVEKKGLDDGIEAVASLRRSGLRIEYDIIGDGPLREHLDGLIARSEARGFVRLLGARDRDTVREALYGSHIFLAPSRTSASGDQEGIPVGIMEAMATGMPVVSTKHSGITELVEDGKTGLLADEGNPEQLAERIRWLIDHPDSWSEIGTAARAKVKSEFDVHLQNDRLEVLYLGRPEKAGR